MTAPRDAIASRRPSELEGRRGELLEMDDGGRWFHPYDGGAPVCVRPGQLTLYLRREPTNDALTRDALPHLTAAAIARLPRMRDVAAYSDREATERKARWAWHRKRPDRRNRWVMLNCYRWRVVWLPDLEPET